MIKKIIQIIREDESAVTDDTYVLQQPRSISTLLYNWIIQAPSNDDTIDTTGTSKIRTSVHPYIRNKTMNTLRIQFTDEIAYNTPTSDTTSSKLGKYENVRNGLDA